MHPRLQLVFLFLLLCLGVNTARAAELRIGVIGLDTFHATQLTQMFNDPKAPGYVAGGRVVAGFRGGSPDLELSRLRLEEVTRQMTEKFGVKHSLQPLAARIMQFFQTGIAPVPLEETLEMFAFMEAADESKRRGGAKVTLAEVLQAAGAGR